MGNSYQTLIDKLDEFIRKYYKSKILRGLIYGSALVLGFYLLVVILEYLGEFGTGVRTFFFWSFLLSSAYILVRFILIPIFHLFKIGKTISHEQASTIIGRHFPNVEDKLLNTLQLKELGDQMGQNELIQASINQKIQELNPVPFKSAIDFKENRKYMKYLIPPLAVFLVLLFAAPSVLKEPTNRLVRHGEVIEKKAPYNISIINEDLSVVQNDDFNLVIELSGNEIPEKIFVIEQGQRFKLERGDNNLMYGHTFHNVKEDKSFQFYGDGFYSKEYELKTIPAPSLLNFNVDLDYPAYTGYKDESLSNTGDLLVPEGTALSWFFETENASWLKLRLKDSTRVLSQVNQNFFESSARVYTNQKYSVLVENDLIQNRDSIVYQIQVIKDNHPSIDVIETRDSADNKNIYFTGEVQDDYGFSKLVFNYVLEESELNRDEIGVSKQIRLDVTPTAQQDQFFHHWNLKNLGANPGDQYSYYFEVWDNDGVNGAKSSRSMTRSLQLASVDELQDQRDEENDDLKEQMEESIDMAKELREELDEMRKEMLQKEEMDWQDKKRMEELLEKQKELQKNIENIQKENQEKNEKQQEFSQENEKLQEKQEKLQELMDQLLTEEMKQLYEDIQKLMEEMDMDQLQEQIQEMDMTNEDLEKELDRALEQFKQLEWEQKMEETIDKLNELAEKQRELAEQSKEKDADAEEIKEEQEKLNEEFKDIQEDMEKLEEMNEDMEDPNAMPDTQEEQENVEQEQQESMEQLEKQKTKKASESQEGAAEEMEKMAQQMQMSMQQQAQESMEEDMDALRALLENIISLSFDEETLMNQMKSVDQKDPLYVKHAQSQRKLKDDAKMVEDSLFALSKRIIQLEAFVNKEIGLVNEHMGEALEHYGERRTEKIVVHQQYVMTSFNNLALMLDEALKQMQQQQAEGDPGSGSCNNPGGKGAKPSAAKMKGMQEGLSKQLEEMKKKMEDYNKGENNSKGMGEMGKEMMQMAAKQRAIRQGMEEMGQKLNEDGSGNGNEFKKIAKEMEEVERDIVNNEVDQETLHRQREILSRLLKAENAEREREKDNKRKSTEAQEQKISTPVSYEEFQKRKEKEVELLRTLPPSLKPYYKEKVNEYFNKLGAE